jgi:hypothetical protein
MGSRQWICWLLLNQEKFVPRFILSFFSLSTDVEGNRFVSKGSWDSIHVVEVVETSATKATYKLTTTVMLSMSVGKEEVGNTNMSGSLTRQVLP